MPHSTAASAEAGQIQPTVAAEGADKKVRLKNTRPRKPNYNYIHRFQLPVEIQPLPPLIPHNPLSVIAVALSYLVQILNPPSQPIYNGYFSSATSSIHITDEKTARALWEMGFFGKGSLSRSEPTWLASQKKKGETSEEATGKRRNERKEFKLERARREQIEIAEKLEAEKDANETDTSAHPIDAADKANISSVITEVSNEAREETVRSLEIAQPIAELKQNLENGIPTPPSTSSSANATPVSGIVAKRKISEAGFKTVRFSPTIEAREFDLSSPVVSPLKHPGPSPLTEAIEVPKTEITNQEHLELSLEETFFLVYGLGVLQVYVDGSDTILDPASLLALFRRHSYFPPNSLSISAEPDDPFMISYVVYHHFRSLGWVVRSGVKFSVDYLLYNRGPAFSHAEFAIIVLPAYSDTYWSETSALEKATKEKVARRSWSWLHSINRVQAQVKKNLVLCYVEVPPPLSAKEFGAADGESVDIGMVLKRYSVREISVKRWTPNRSRD